MRNSLKLLIAALAIGGTVAGTAAYAFSNRSSTPLEKIAYAINETSYSSSYFKLRYDYKSTSHRVGLGTHLYFEEGIDTNFTLVWDNSDSDSFYIKVDDQYINANQTKNEIQLVDSENASKWTIENGAIKQGEKYLYFNPGAPRVSAYAIKDNYPIAYFYTPAEYADNISRCNWSSFAQECLTKIQYNSEIESEPELSISESSSISYEESVESSEESTESIKNSEEVKSQVVSFAASSGSGEHDAASLGELMIGDLIAEVDNVSKIYKNTGSGGAHPNKNGIIKTGTANVKGTMTITCTEPVKSISFLCHDFYKPSEQYPTNSNKIIINGVEKLAPYNTDAVGEDLEFTFDEPTDTINFEANRVYIWSLTIIA